MCRTADVPGVALVQVVVSSLASQIRFAVRSYDNQQACDHCRLLLKMTVPPATLAKPALLEKENAKVALVPVPDPGDTALTLTARGLAIVVKFAFGDDALPELLIATTCQ